MEENKPNENKTEAPDVTAATYAAIADRVRADSVNSTRLTSFENVSSLLPEPEKVEAFVASMLASEDYRDIKLLVAADGARYLFCEKAINRREAERLAFAEEVRGHIAARVREDSIKLAALTPLATLSALIPGAEVDKIDGHLAVLLKDERYKDIRLIANSSGNRYLYSEESLTANYAEILARAEVKDSYETIAATVRNESRVYPRPTPLQTFDAPVFKVSEDDVRRFASELERRPEYKDIKMIKASTGAVYLYSDLFLNHDWVQATVEWEEVGKHLNP